jgi:hypothetical protein
VQVAGPAGDVWQDRGIEPVVEHDRLPALVLRGEGPRLPLTLQLDEVPGSGVAALLCERALIQVTPDDDGLLCRARYFVDRVNADAVDVAFPIKVAELRLRVHGGDRELVWESLKDDKAIRIPLRGLAAPPWVLEIEYRLPAATQEARAVGVATLVPPVFRDAVRPRLRWQLNLGPDTVAVPLTAGARPDFRWGWHRGLLAVEPGLSAAELEGWLLGNGGAADARTANLSFWPAGPEPQRVLQQPLLPWVVLVSGSLVVLFLILYALRLSRMMLVALLALAALAGLVVALIWPALLPVLFMGAQPALAVVGLLLTIIWLLRERERRQLVFIPSFTRLKTASSLVRTNKPSKRPREASTVDAPPPAGVGGPSSTAGKK